jgi:hypothetical protein
MFGRRFISTVIIGKNELTKSQLNISYRSRISNQTQFYSQSIGIHSKHDDIQLISPISEQKITKLNSQKFIIFDQVRLFHSTTSNCSRSRSRSLPDRKTEKILNDAISDEDDLEGYFSYFYYLIISVFVCCLFVCHHVILIVFFVIFFIILLLLFIVSGTKIPKELEQHYTDLSSVRTKRDSIHDRKVKRLQDLHSFAKRYLLAKKKDKKLIN